MARIPAWTRLALLTVLAFGVAGMHTLGHQSLAIAATAITGHTSSHATTAVPAAPQAARPMAHGAATGPADAPGGPHHPVSPLSVCLAILSLAVLVFLGVIAAVRASGSLARHTHAVTALWLRAGRAPPTAIPAGLALATVSVMRL